MKKTLTFVFAAALMVGFWSGCSKDDGDASNGDTESKETTQTEATSTQAIAKAQTICPIGGDAIDKASFVDYKSERIYMCCDGCKSKFSADADNIVAKMKKDGIKLATAE